MDRSPARAVKLAKGQGPAGDRSLASFVALALKHNGSERQYRQEPVKAVPSAQSGSTETHRQNNFAARRRQVDKKRKVLNETRIVRVLNTEGMSWYDPGGAIGRPVPYRARVDMVLNQRDRCPA
jgi:hypothetical protein